MMAINIFIALNILFGYKANGVSLENSPNGANFSFISNYSSGGMSNVSEWNDQNEEGKNATTLYMEYEFTYNLDDMDTTFNLNLHPDTDALMMKNSTLEYLATFRSGLERELVYQQLRNCPYTRLCSFTLAQSFPTYLEPCCKECSCNFPDCLFTRSCCIDILLKETQILTDAHFQDFEPKCSSLSLAYNELDPAYTRGYGAFLVNTCPLGTEQQLDANCSRHYTSEIQYYRDIVPVAHFLSPAIYRNRYCAICNGVEDEYLRQLNVLLTCEDTSVNLKTEHESIKAAIDEDMCDLDFQSPDGMNFEICTSAISRCNVTGQWETYDPEIEKACLMYSLIVNVNKTYYNNVFCAQCNGITNIEPLCQYNPFDMKTTKFSFSGLLKLEFSEEKTKYNVNPHGCSIDQLFDSTSGDCRDIVCSPLMTLKQGLCQPKFTKVHYMYYMMYLRIKPIESTTLLQGYLLADRLISYLFSMHVLKDACQAQMIYEVNQDPYSGPDLKNATLTYFKVRVMTLKSFHDPYQLYNEYSMIHKSNHSIIYFDFFNQKLSEFKVEFELFDHDPFFFNLIDQLNVSEIDQNFVSSRNDSLDVLIERYSFVISNSSVYLFHMNQNRICSSAPDNDKALNLLHLNPCPKVFIPNDQVPWQSIDDGIIFTNTNQTLSNSKFYYNGSYTVAVCIDFYKQYMLKLSPIPDLSLSAMTIVSIVCTVVSVVSLLITLIVFFLLPKLRRSIPGKNNMSLVSVLIIGQGFYLFSSAGIFELSTPQCTAFGMILHFVWLLSLFWMNICTYHMFHVLTRTKTMSGKTGNIRFGIYHFYAIIMSTMMVGINVIISVTTSGVYGYGENTCYIDTQDMVTYTFTVPAAVVILSNFGMYLITVYKIKMTSSVKKNVKNERNDFIIFIKLSTITGATWVFGFIYSLTDIIAFSYLFILFNASQGVFIMFAFIINHRVINMFRANILGHDVTFTDTESKSTRSNIHSKS